MRPFFRNLVVVLRDCVLDVLQGTPPPQSLARLELAKKMTASV